MSPCEALIRQHLPGLIPTGWARLVSRVVHRADGMQIMAYSGHGLVVTVKAGSFCWVEVKRRQGKLTHHDLEQVLYLFDRSPCAQEMRMLYLRQKRVVGAAFTFVFTEHVGTLHA